ncbi:hypothetical protein ACN38_g2246 [Penicillium nordicum]|uniref:Uncharacterized protein n=1 Tax=Penicillium nordicum TaxID=229535 RepID=A0A0M8PFQ6_9EURO|nr:hypothetical protein ACN38_g2246 [Penicillium nordicum]
MSIRMAHHQLQGQAIQAQGLSKCTTFMYWPLVMGSLRSGIRWAFSFCGEQSLEELLLPSASILCGIMRQPMFSFMRFIYSAIILFGLINYPTILGTRYLGLN